MKRATAMKNIFQMTPPENTVNTQCLKDEDDLLYSREFFHEILQIERKRSARSGTPVVLLLMRLFGNQDRLSNPEFVRSIASALKNSTREVDIKGWFKERSVIGVLFTEIKIPRNRAINVLKERINDQIRDILNAHPGCGLEMSFNWYPEEAKDIELRNGENMIFYPVLRNDIWTESQKFIKRSIDILGSVSGLFILFPFFLIISIGIKSTSRGPVFFRQERLGLHGKRFGMLKFRTMYTENSEQLHRDYVKNLINGNTPAAGHHENEPEKTYKMTSDPRITPFGKFLRKLSLDELPQFINVLKGEMSLVGPRPPIPYEFDEYKIWHRNRVVEVKPGITGLWQVKGRSSCNFDDMVRLDLRYIHNWSIWLDIKILLQTPWAVLRGKGAY